MDAKSLRRSFIAALVAVSALLVAVTGATFAWYIYNTTARTTSIHMAAGAGLSLEISSAYDGDYGTSVILEEFTGALTPVSTDSILSGFQKVEEFKNIAAESEEQRLVASIFGAGEESDYYMTSLWLRSGGGGAKVYLSDIGFEDSDPEKPISSAIRVGFVIHAPGQNGAEVSELIFAISDAKNPEKDYNTERGQEGHVLDSSRTDGSTVPFSPYTSANFAIYDRNTGATTVLDSSVPLFELPENKEPVCVDVYVWLEGCDEDCTVNIAATTLKDVALQFSAAY